MTFGLDDGHEVAFCNPRAASGQASSRSAGQLAVDAPVAPARLSRGHLQHQTAYRLRPSRSAIRVHPPSPDQDGVPSQQGLRWDDKAHLTELAIEQQSG